MESPMRLTWPDAAAIRALASSESFERGRSYAHRGAVSSLILRGDELTAEVRGSAVSPYHVSVRIQAGRIAAARCTCPYDWGGSCKHIVAVLLKVSEDPGAVTARPSLRDVLGRFDRDGLIALILRQADRDPELTGWIEADVATVSTIDHGIPVDPVPLAAQARAVLAGRYRQGRYWDEFQPSGDAAELRILVENAVPFLEAGDDRNALRVLEAVAEPFVDEWIACSDGSDEHMYVLFSDLGQMMAEAALLSDLSPAERETLAETLADWQEQLGEYGVEESFGVAIRALKAGWDAPALQAVLAGEATTWPASDTDEWDERALTATRLRVLDACGRTDAYLRLARAAAATTSVATMLVRLERVPEAIVYAQETFTTPGEALDLAKVLRKAGRDDEALTIAETGLRLGKEGTDDADWWPGRSAVPVSRWLRDYAGSIGRGDLALSAARTAFEHTLSLQDFDAAKACAGQHWDEVRKDLLARLTAAPRASDRVEILLNEGSHRCRRPEHRRWPGLRDERQRSLASHGGRASEPLRRG